MTPKEQVFLSLIRNFPLSFVVISGFWAFHGVIPAFSCDGVYYESIFSVPARRL